APASIATAGEWHWRDVFGGARCLLAVPHRGRHGCARGVLWPIGRALDDVSQQYPSAGLRAIGGAAQSDTPSRPAWRARQTRQVSDQQRVFGSNGARELNLISR